MYQREEDICMCREATETPTVFRNSNNDRRGEPVHNGTTRLRKRDRAERGAVERAENERTVCKSAERRGG